VPRTHRANQTLIGQKGTVTAKHIRVGCDGVAWPNILRGWVRPLPGSLEVHRRTDYGLKVELPYGILKCFHRFRVDC
jgi:hypothetical protein